MSNEELSDLIQRKYGYTYNDHTYPCVDSIFDTAEESKANRGDWSISKPWEEFGVTLYEITDGNMGLCQIQVVKQLGLNAEDLL